MIADLLNFKKLRMAALYALVAALVVFFQDTIFARISLLGVKMLFVPAACAAVGMFEGGFRGGLFGLNRLLSLGGGLLLAAAGGQQAQSHGQGQQNGKYFFHHNDSPFFICLLLHATGLV